MKGLINKPNRKFLAANCLLIAAKLNDITKKGKNIVNIYFKEPGFLTILPSSC